MFASGWVNWLSAHRPNTTDGIAASRSMTYTIGRRRKRGATSVTKSAMPMLTGTAKSRAIVDTKTVPYASPKAPKCWWAGSQFELKIALKPSALNQSFA